ncbi:hypothetical protein Tco_1377461 [Tanacetum coccineum]
MAQNKDNIFQADQCDAFDSDVDEAPTAKTMFMANLSSAEPVYDVASPSYDSDTLSEVQDHANCLNNMNEYHEEHEMQNDGNEEQVVQNDVSSVPNDAIMMITNDIYEQDVQCVTSNQPNKTIKAKQVQPALYNGHEIVKSNHDRALVHDSEDTLKIAETTRKQMIKKMKDPECMKKKAKALKEKAKFAKPITAMTVYPPNTLAKLIPKVLPTKSQVQVNIYSLVQLFSEFHKTYKKRITPTGPTEREMGFEQTKTCYLTEVIPFFKTIKEHFEGIQTALIKEIKEMKEVFDQIEVEVDKDNVDKKCTEIERKNILIKNDNLIVECLSKDVFYNATNFMLTVSKFSNMHDAYSVAQKYIVKLEAGNLNMKNKIQNDDHDEMIKPFSKLEVEHLNLQLKYQHLKEHRGNKKPVTSSDALAFDSVFVIGNLKEQLQGRGNLIQELKETISRLKKKHSKADPVLDFKALDS